MTRLRDWHTPQLAPPSRVEAHDNGQSSGRWDQEAIGTLFTVLEAAGADDPRHRLAPRAVWAAWCAAVEEVLSDQELHHAIAASARLSPAGAAAALDAVLSPTIEADALDLLERGWQMPQVPSPLLAILPATVPGIATQTVLPAIARGRPLCLKSARDEPWSTPALLASLARHLPDLRGYLAAVVWRGGDSVLEELAAARAGAVLAYGSDLALAQWRTRDVAVVGLGPRASCAVIDVDRIDDRIVAGLVQDTVLLDQRGCLSLAGVVSIGNFAAAETLASRLVQALAVAARDLPPGPALSEELAAAQAWRLTAQASGCTIRELAQVELGAVVVDPEGDPLATPGLRHLTIVPVPDPASALSCLEGSSHRLQGVALTGPASETLRSSLESLGATWICAPGHLQRPSALWRNAATSPLELVARGR